MPASESSSPIGCETLSALQRRILHVLYDHFVKGREIVRLLPSDEDFFDQSCMLVDGDHHFRFHDGAIPGPVLWAELIMCDDEPEEASYIGAIAELGALGLVKSVRGCVACHIRYRRPDGKLILIDQDPHGSRNLILINDQRVDAFHDLHSAAFPQQMAGSFRITQSGLQCIREYVRATEFDSTGAATQERSEPHEVAAPRATLDVATQQRKPSTGPPRHDFKFDDTRETASWRGLDLALSGAEYSVLRALCAKFPNHGHHFDLRKATGEQLSDNLTSVASSPRERQVIKSLNNKLESIKCDCSAVAVHGFGYKLQLSDERPTTPSQHSDSDRGNTQ